MRIGIDIDGVLTNIEQYQLDVCSKYAYELFNKEIKNGNEYDTMDIFGLTKAENDELWSHCILDYGINERPRKFAREIIKKLKNDGNEIYIITARTNTERDDQSGEKNRDMVKTWLKNNDIYYDKLIFSSRDKFEICKSNKIDLMIEDKVDNINKISLIIPVICFNACYNKECVGENIIRCYSWYDVYNKIRNMY